MGFLNQERVLNLMVGEQCCEDQRGRRSVVVVLLMAIDGAFASADC
jgi:hypothetical protein